MWLLLTVWLCSKNATKGFNKCLCEFNILSFSSRLVKYFFLFISFYFFQYSKRIFKFCCKRLIFIQTNIYVKTYTGMQISRCRSDKTIVSDNFKKVFIILIWRKLNMFNFFILKWKRIKKWNIINHAITHHHPKYTRHHPPPAKKIHNITHHHPKNTVHHPPPSK